MRIVNTSANSTDVVDLIFARTYDDRKFPGGGADDYRVDLKGTPLHYFENVVLPFGWTQEIFQPLKAKEPVKIALWADSNQTVHILYLY